MAKEPTFLGLVQDVRGSLISVSLDEETVTGLAFINGQGYRVGQVGSFVRIPQGYIDLFGVVSQVGAGAVPERLAASQPQGFRWMTVQLLGESSRRGHFQRGVSQYPTVSDSVHLVDEVDLARIYGRPDEPQFVKIGTLASAESISALIDVNRLVARHSAVVGTTGSGKSTTVAGILNALSHPSVYPSARIILIDIHGEYAAALRDRSTVFRLQPDAERGEKPLSIPYWAMGADELLPLTFGSLTDSDRAAICEKILALKIAAVEAGKKSGLYSTVDPETLTVDTPVPFSIHKLWYDLHLLVYATHSAQQSAQSSNTIAFQVDASNRPIVGDALSVRPPKFLPIKAGSIYLSVSTLNIKRQVDLLGSKLRDPRFDFLLRPGDWTPSLTGDVAYDLDHLLKQWLGSESPITILDLSGVPSGIVSNVLGALLRILYDALFWSKGLSEGGRERPLLVVLEEAHKYLNSAERGSATEAVRSICREGRKYGIGVMLVSQRPSEIDATILSQCGTLFALRLTNVSDRSHVAAVAPDNFEGVLGMLPILRTGEAVVLGEAVQLPMRTLISPPASSRRPDSNDPKIVGDEYSIGGWNVKLLSADYSAVVSSWRAQVIRKVSSMKRLEVISSNVASVGYDPEQQVMEVEFKNGGVYQYFDVPETVYLQVVNSGSVGGALNAIVKGSYRYVKL